MLCNEESTRPVITTYTTLTTECSWNPTPASQTVHSGFIKQPVSVRPIYVDGVPSTCHVEIVSNGPITVSLLKYVNNNRIYVRSCVVINGDKMCTNQGYLVDGYSSLPQHLRFIMCMEFRTQ